MNSVALLFNPDLGLARSENVGDAVYFVNLKSVMVTGIGQLPR